MKLKTITRVFALSFSLLIGLSNSNLKANNLIIGTPSIVGSNSIQFTVQWDNSWRLATGPSNWDAVWLFVKYQDCATNLWSHVDLSTTVSNHTVAGTQLEVITVADAKGVYLRQNTNAVGNITSALVTLRFSTLVNAGFNYQVFGVEMVNIPTGNFVLGDCTGGSSGGNFYCQYITSAMQAAGLGSGAYGGGVWAPTLTSAYPMGVNSFYCMKYEISQEQYVAFLNTLTYDQQVNITSVPPQSAVGTLAIAPNTNGRNGIRIQTPGALSNIPAVYGNDLNNNGTFNEAADGQNIACNYLQWSDLMAYLDWSALRPMTEFEYEKVCRGPLPQVVNEYVWGVPAAQPSPAPITQALSSAIANAGTASEVSTASGIGLCAWGANNAALGPLRCGFAATASTSRVQAGGSYYGCMDMAGNVWEQCVGGAYNPGTNYGGFAGAVGDGLLLATGYANASGWSAWGGSSTGGCLRGGDWYTGDARLLQTSDRPFTNTNSYLYNLNQGRDLRIGGRGVR
jgi:formylglycine-generating enzyme required for sulfatase activity